MKVSWKDYVDTRFSAADHAVEIALAELGRRLGEMNEFRAENKEQAAGMVSRDKYDADVARIEGLIATEREARQRAEGSVSTWRFIALFLGLPGIGALILSAIALAQHAPVPT